MISIVTITFNNFKELERTYQSIGEENLRSSDLEWIVINGGTCQQTKNFLKENKIIHISESDAGIYDAYNKGIKLAKGEFITFLNSGDTLIDKRYYTNAFKWLQQGFDILHSDILFGKEPQSAKRLGIKSSSNPGKGIPFLTPSTIIKKSLFNELGAFSLKYRISSDYEWFLRVFNENVKIKKLSSTPILMDDSGISKTQEKRSLEECRLALIENKLFYGRFRTGFYERLLRYKVRTLLNKLI